MQKSLFFLMNYYNNIFSSYNIYFYKNRLQFNMKIKKVHIY